MPLLQARPPTLPLYSYIWFTSIDTKSSTKNANIISHEQTQTTKSTISTTNAKTKNEYILPGTAASSPSYNPSYTPSYNDYPTPFPSPFPTRFWARERESASEREGETEREREKGREREGEWGRERARARVREIGRVKRGRERNGEI